MKRAEGSLCANRRRGCVGRIVRVTARYRPGPGEPLQVRECLQCNRCGQAYGVADA